MEEQEKQKSTVREILEYIVWLVGVFIAAQLFTNFVGVPSVVDGASMEPTLYNGEYLWVDKLSYILSEPERFDVVIFPIEYQGRDSHFVKRIIALPGETIYIDEGGNIYINDEVLQDPYGKEVISSQSRGMAAEPITLGEDEYFVMGDNRNYSSDSRYDTVGNIEKERLIGRVVLCLWPFDKIGIVK